TIMSQNVGAKPFMRQSASLVGKRLAADARGSRGVCGEPGRCSALCCTRPREGAWGQTVATLLSPEGAITENLVHPFVPRPRLTQGNDLLHGRGGHPERSGSSLGMRGQHGSRPSVGAGVSAIALMAIC